MILLLPHCVTFLESLMVPLWVFMCLFMLDSKLKNLPQMVHPYGFSPVCVFMCLSMVDSKPKKLPQMLQVRRARGVAGAVAMAAVGARGENRGW